MKILGFFGSLLLSLQLVHAAEVELQWDASVTPNIDYIVYYGETSGSYDSFFVAGSDTSATVTNLVPGTTYFFVVTAAYLDIQFQSFYSNEVSYTPPVIEEKPTPENPDPEEFDYIVLPHIEDYELAEGVLEVSFSTTDPSIRQGIFSKDSSGYDDGGHLSISIENGGLYVRAQTDSRSIEIRGGNIAANQLHKLVFTWNASGTLLLFLDDLPIGSADGWSGLAANKEPIVLGALQTRSGDLVANNISDKILGAVSDFSISQLEETPLPVVERLTDIAASTVLDHRAEYELSSGSIYLQFETDEVSSLQGLFSKDSSGFDDGGHLDVYIHRDRVVVRAQSTSESIVLNCGALAQNSLNSLLISWLEDGTLECILNDGQSRSKPGWVGLSNNLEPIVLGARQTRSSDYVADRIENPFKGRLLEFVLSRD